MKKLHWYGWVAIVGFLALVVEVYAFGGLLQQPDVGPAVAVQARKGAPVMHTYLVAGRHVLQWTPFMRGSARDLAGAVWGDAYAPIRETPSLAVYLLDHKANGAVHDIVHPLYWLAPLLLLAALIGWMFRPRPVSLIRNDSGNR
jgi:hypothetical protein